MDECRPIFKEYVGVGSTDPSPHSIVSNHNNAARAASAQSQLRIVVLCSRLRGHWHDLSRGIGGRSQAPKSLGLVFIYQGAIVTEENIYADMPH